MRGNGRASQEREKKKKQICSKNPDRFVRVRDRTDYAHDTMVMKNNSVGPLGYGRWARRVYARNIPGTVESRLFWPNCGRVKIR